jgi:hypothetical protein
LLVSIGVSVAGFALDPSPTARHLVLAVIAAQADPQAGIVAVLLAWVWRALERISQ